MNLIPEYIVPFYAIEKSEGHYDPNTGKYVDGSETKVKHQGMILPISEDDLKYSDPGTYSVFDRKLYTKSYLKNGQEIEYQGKRYTVRGSKEYGDLEGINIYLVKRAGDSS